MTLTLSDKEARKLGLIAADAPRQKRGRKAPQNTPAEVHQKPVAPREGQSTAPARKLSYEAAGAAGWLFVTGPSGVMAWRHIRGGGVEKTGRYPEGEGRIDQHYRAALDAIQRGDYERAERL